MTQREDMHKIADHFGPENQRFKSIEECNEYIDAVRKLQHAIDLGEPPEEIATLRLNVIEEAADAILTIEQNVYLLKGESDCKKMRQYKIERTLKRIETGYYADGQLQN